MSLPVESTYMEKQHRERRRDMRVYVVSNFERGGNDRVRKVVRLRDRFDRLVLVTPGTKLRDDSESLVVPPIPNPLGLLRLLRLDELKRWLEGYLYFPTVHRLFVERVKHRLARRIEADLAEGKRVTLLTTAPPHALGLIGLYIKQRFPTVRWVLDWQDLWSYDENYYLRVPRLYRPAVRRLEQRMLSCADLNVTTNARARQVLEREYGVPSNRVQHIHHHFDRGDFQAPSEPPETQAQGAGRSPIRIGFLGTLFKPPRVPGLELVEAIQDMRGSGLDVELHVHGHVSREIQSCLAGSAGIHLHGRVTHEESVNRLGAYDYLLLLLSDLPNCRAVMSIKLPHYMVVERPILAIVPKESAIADIVSETGTGFVVPVAEDWRAGLRKILQSNSAADAMGLRAPQAIEQYAWEHLSDRWVQALVTGQSSYN